MLKIGNIELEFPFFQAPLSGYTDRAMRVLGRKFGCPLVFGGLMLDKSAVYSAVRRKPEFCPDKDIHPVGAQIVGFEPEVMAKAATILVEQGFDLIDLNFACPAPKVLRRGRGGALLRDPAKVREIFKAVRTVVDCPVTMKIRNGYGEGEESQAAYLKICEDAARNGVDALVIHGRTVMQYYRGKANWNDVYKIKELFPELTIIGSGDLMKAQDIKDRLEGGPIDGVAIARGAIGNPWIFQETASLLQGKELSTGPTIAQQKEVILEHLKMLGEDYVERKFVGYFRKFGAKYAKRHPDRKKMMLEMMNAKSLTQWHDVLDKWY
ncbi:MAG: tRNA-dihydrouridine synthase [Phycisphaerae bacterium]|nr:tRNA-dihydrouridine synthase [Phycisphaerae bacterium]